MKTTTLSVWVSMFLLVPLLLKGQVLPTFTAECNTAPEDMILPSLDMDASNTAPYMSFLLTDLAGVILQIDDDYPSINNLALGDYYLYAYVYSESLDATTLSPNTTIFNISNGDSCYDFSSPLQIAVCEPCDLTDVDLAVSYPFLDCDGDGTLNLDDDNPYDPCVDNTIMVVGSDCDGDGYLAGVNDPDDSDMCTPSQMNCCNLNTITISNY